MNRWGRLFGLMVPVVALFAILGAADAALAITPQVAAGLDFSVALRSDGTIWASGGNELGQLGDGTTLQRNTPVQAGLPGNGANWTAIAAGEEHVVAIRADGTLWGWGANNFGQLGKGFADPQLVPTPSPVQIGTATDWVAVAAGAASTVALKSDGSLWAWGANNAGQLGNGDASGATQLSPVAVLNPGNSRYVAVAITNLHVLALQADGSLWSWGSNQFGELGINSVDLNVHATPVKLQVFIGDPTNEITASWTAISAGGWHSVARQSDGTLWSWGRNSIGQIGNGSGSANNVTVPVQIGTDNSWAGFSAGAFHTVAFKRNGTIWTWGANNKGQLGIGGTVDTLRHSTPIQITTPADISHIIAVAAGSGHSMAAKANGDLYAWGDNAFGQLGTGSGVNNVTVSSTVPVLATQDSLGWVAVEAGGQHTMGRRSNGTLWAWGDNSSGQGSIDPLTTPVITSPVQVGTADTWSIISGGLQHTAALRADGTLWTWGGNGLGQLGDGTTSDNFTPQQITVTSPVSPANEWLTVSSGDSHTLALQNDGSLWAWGDNGAGQLGDGTTVAQSAPIRIVTGNPGNFDNNWVAISAGGLFSVGIQADGTLWVWGDNAFGQLGVDPLALASSTTPFQVVNFTPPAGNPGFNSGWTAIAAGFNHLLALQADGTAWGLGANSAGQLGNGSSAANQFDFFQVQNIGTPVPYVAIAAGDSHSVALKADGSIWSMGNNTSGQLGIGATDPDIFNPVVHAVPTRESSSANDWVAISAGGRHTVAFKADGSLAAWGDNAFGQLGDGTTNPHNSPNLLLERRISVPASASFGTVALAGPYSTVSITITNSGTGTLQLTSTIVGGANGAMFTIAPGGTCAPPQAIAAGGSCTVDVTFTPASAGAKAATLTIVSDDPVRPSVAVALSGTGFTPFTINAQATAGGTISPSGAAVPVTPDGSQLFTIVPNPGFRIADVAVDGSSVGPVGSYLFSAVANNTHTITATFAALTFMDGWNWRNPLPTGHSLRRVATNGAGVHVAVGDYGTILRSIDNGANWAMIDNGSHTLNGVVFGSGKFVAVGSHGRILTSPDGLTWTARHSGTNTELQGVAFGDGTFVAVGNTQTDPTTLQPSAPVFTSQDGTSWIPRLLTLPVNSVLDLHDVAFGSDGGLNNVFVAAGQGGYLLKSADKGVTWLLNGVAPIDPAQALPNGIGTFDFFDIHFAANTFVAVGASGQVYTSGIAATAWTQHDITSFADLKSVTFNNALFLTVGAQGEIWSSPNGTAWTQRTSGLESTQLGINSVSPAGTGFLAVGDDGHILTSTDGATWAVPYPQTVSPSTLRDVTYANGIYTAVGDVESNGKAAILRSLNGSTWSKVAASPATHNLQGVSFGNGLLVAVGDSGIDQTGDPASRPEILTSSDNGATWTKRTVATTPATSLNLYGIAFGGNQFVAVGDWDIDTFNAIILTSPDGIAWTRRSNPSPDILRRITYSNGKFVAVGGAGTVLVSADGITWSNHSISFGPEFSGVAVKPGIPATLAAVGTNSTNIYRSTDDGSTWTIASHGPANLPTGILRDITYANGFFGAVAESGFIFSSADAITWTTRMGADIFPFGTRELFSVTFGNGRFLATGFNGTIMSSSADTAAAALPALSLSPASLSLAAVDIGTTTDTVFTVTNRGGSDLTIGSITPGNAGFTILNDECITTLAAGASCTFTVRFTPALPSGTVTSTTLTIASNDPGTPAIAALSGTSIDTTPPATAITPIAGNYTGSVTISLSSEANSSIYYTTDGSAPTAILANKYTGPFAIGGDGQAVTVRYFAVDQAGNAGAVANSAYNFTHTDDMAATVSINNGAPFTNNRTVSLAFTASDPFGMGTMSFSSDGATFTTPVAYAAATALPLTLATPGDGLKTVYFRFTDNAAVPNTYTFTSSITLDTAAPVTQTTPVAGTYNGSVSVTLSTPADPGSTIFYTTGTGTPATVYTGPITLSASSLTTFNLRYFAVDPAGNAEAVKTTTYIIHVSDLIGGATINNGAAFTNSTQVSLNLSATDPANVKSYAISTDNINFNTVAITPAGSFTSTVPFTLPSGDGLKTVYVRFTDGLDNNYLFTAQITLDTSVPATAITPIAGNYTGSVTVSLSSEANSSIYYTTDGSAPTAILANKYTGPFVIGGDGQTVTVRYFAVDQAGNAGAVAGSAYNFTHTNDMAATVSVNNGAAFTNNRTVSLAFTASDPFGVSSMSFSSDGTTFTTPVTYAAATALPLTLATPGDGLKTVYFRFTDNAAVRNTYTFTAAITLDTTAPVTQTTPVAGTYDGSVSVTLSTPADPGSTIFYTTGTETPATVYTGPITLSASLLTTFDLRYFAVDPAGNSEAVKTSTYIIHVGDLTGGVTINNGAAFTNSTQVSLNLSATDPANVKSYAISTDNINFNTVAITPAGSFTSTVPFTLPSGDGLKTVYVRYTDGLDNTYLFTSQITLDTVTPAAAITPLAGDFAGNVSVSLSSEANSSIYYTTDGSAPTAILANKYTVPFVIGGAGQAVTVRYFAVDQAGNAGSVDSSVYNFAHDDDMTATISINNGAAFTNNRTVSLAFTATDLFGMGTMSFSSDGTTFTTPVTYAAATALPLTLATPGDGLKTVYFRFTDNAAVRNTYTFTSSITLDTTAPVTQASPVAGTYNGSVSVTLSTPADPGSTIFYTTDGSTPTSASAKYSAPFTVGAPGQTVTVKFLAMDQAGNTEQFKSVTYLIGHENDMTASVSINGGVPFTTSQSVTLAFTALDPVGGGVATMSFSNDGTNFSTPVAYASATAFPWTLSSGNGLKTVYFRFVDKGTPANTYTFTASITLAPAVSGPASGDLNGDGAVDVSDALRTLQVALGLVVPTAAERVAADVAPVVNGVPVPDGQITVADALVTLRKVVGLLGF